MKPSILIAAPLLLALAAAARSGPAPQRTISCKTPANEKQCYWAHGRLGYTNGTPALRLWKVGTRRVLGIYSGPSAYDHNQEDPDMGDNEDPQLPGNVKRTFLKNTDQGFPLRMFADFEVCPLEPEKSGAMQAACIESAKNIVVEK